MPLDPDAELMIKACEGDSSAFEILVTKYQKSVLNTIYRTINDATEAEDIAQTVFVQVWRYRSRYKPTAKFSTWLFTIARNTCLNEIRRRARHPADSLDKPISNDPESDEQQWQLADPNVKPPTEEALSTELYARVESAVNSLPEPQRTALVMLRYENMPYEEIAKLLNCSLAATKSIIHRARQTLRDELKPYLND